MKRTTRQRSIMRFRSERRQSSFELRTKLINDRFELAEKTALMLNTVSNNRATTASRDRDERQSMVAHILTSDFGVVRG